MDPKQNPKPLFITEEEVAPPPLTSFPVAPPPTPPIPPSSPIFKIDNSLPPIMSTPPKKKGKGKLIAGIAAVLVIVVALPIGLILVGQNQELRKNAAVDGGGGDGGAPTGTFECSQDEADNGARDEECAIGNGCTGTKYSEYDSSDDGQIYCHWSGCGEPITCPQPTTAPSQPTTALPSSSPTTAVVAPEPTSGSGTGRNGESAGGNWASSCSALSQVGHIVSSNDGKRIDDEALSSCAVVQQFVTQWGDRSGRRWAVERTCGSSVAQSCDGNKTLDGEQGNIVADFIGRFGSNACSRWVTDHNAVPSVAAACQTGGAPACTGVRIYKYPYGTSDLISNGSQLMPGDAIKVCLVSTGNGTPMVNVNGREGVAQENGPQGEKCLQYDISGDATTLSANGWITY